MKTHELEQLLTHLISVNAWGNEHLSHSTIIGICAGIKRVKLAIESSKTISDPARANL